MQEEFMKYVNDKKLLDERIYEKFTEYFVKKMKLDKVVTKIDFDNDIFSHYNQFEKKIVLNLDQIYDYAIGRSFINGKKDVKENVYFINSELLFYLLHELTHGKQINIIEKREQSNELIIKALEDSYDRLQFQKLYNRFHDYYLIEHHANTEGQFMLSEFLYGLDDGYGFDVGPLYYYLTLAYEEYNKHVLSPLEKENMMFFIRLKIDEFMKKEEYLKMKEYDKIIFGFPVKEDTYEKINDVAYNKVKDYKAYFK